MTTANSPHLTITYTAYNGEQRTISMAPNNPVFCERSGIEMVFFSGTKKVLKCGPVSISNNQGQIIWRIIPSTLGMPSGPDRLVFRALEKLAHQKQNILENPRLDFSYHDILGLLYPDRPRQSVSGQERNRIRQAIRRIANQSIEVVGQYADQEKDVYLEQGGARFIESYGFLGQVDKTTGNRHDNNWIVFGDFYRYSLKRNRPKPLFFEFMRELDSPIALALYERLQAPFWHGHTFQIQYSDLTAWLGLQSSLEHDRTENRRRARAYLKRPHEELLRKQFIAGYRYTNLNAPSGTSDFLITYTPGSAFTKQAQPIPSQEKQTTDATARALVKRFHRKRNHMRLSQIKPKPPEIAFIQQRLREWGQDVEKVILFIDYGVRQYLDQTFHQLGSMVVNSLKHAIPDFETHYQDLLKQVEPYRSKVQARLQGQSLLQFPNEPQPRFITRIGTIGVQVGHNLEDCRILQYAPRLLHAELSQPCQSTNSMQKS